MPHVFAKGGKQAARGSSTRSAPKSPLSVSSRAAIQNESSVGSAGDLYEQEADRVADRVIGMHSSSPVESASSKDAPHAGERAKSQSVAGMKKRQLQRSSADSGILSPAPPLVQQVLRGAGQPLERSTRDSVEQRFGWDFGRIRIHADSRAAESARSVGASAYTVGQNIVFGSGQYSPGTLSGQRLLAHELTHVLQQDSGRPAIQRQTEKVDVAQVAAEVEKLACVSQDEAGALTKLNSLKIDDLLQVSIKLYDNWVAAKAPDPMITMQHFGDSYKGLGELSAWALLSIDLYLTPPNARTSAVTEGKNVAALRAAFDAARVHTQRNPKGKDRGTNPTHAGARDLSKLGQPARPGDWGEDKWGNTWVAHAGSENNSSGVIIRTYWKDTTEKKKRSSQWLGNNVGNFGYNPAVSKRAIGSFKWGSDFRAIYLREADSGLDIKDNMAKYKTVGTYIDKGHLGPTDDRTIYYNNIITKAKEFKPEDRTSDWLNDPSKWSRLLEGFKKAEGWTEGTEVTAVKIAMWSKGASANSLEAEQIAYYATLIGVPVSTPAAAPATPNPAQGTNP